jgi:signal transduction histidine kinase
MDALKGLLIFYAAIMGFNVLFSAVLWYQYSHRHYRTQFFVWLGYSFGFVIQGMASSGTYLEKVLAFCAGCVGFFMGGELLAALLSIPFFWRRMISVYLSGVGLTLLFAFLNAPVWLMALPGLIGSTFPMLYTSLYAFIYRRKQLTAASGLYAACLLMAGLHGVDYAYAIDKPEYHFLGFTIALVAASGLATFSTAAIVESLTADSIRARFEVAYGAALASAARLSALGEMAGGIAHEINTPLAVIAMKSRHVQRFVETRLPDEKQIVKFSQDIQDTALRIAAIIKGLRSFSRDVAQEPTEDCPIWRIVEDTLVLCREKLHSERIQMEDLASRLDAKAKCRPTQVAQVLLNLLNNARDAVEGREHPWIRIESKVTERGWVDISVEDSGAGIPADQRDKLFQPFFTTKPIGAGMGLGLSLSLGLIESQGGKLFLDERAHHTRFVIRLPEAKTA